MASGLFGDLTRFIPQMGGLLGQPNGWQTPGINPNAPAGPAAPAGQGPTTVAPVRPEDPPLIKIGKWATPSARQLMIDPRFQMGMNILAANSQGGNIFGGALQGMQQAQQNRLGFESEDLAAQQRQREEQEWGWKQEAYRQEKEQLARDEQLRGVFGQQGLTPDQALQGVLQYGRPDLQQEVIGQMATGLLGGASDPTSQQKNFQTLMEIRQTYGEGSPQEQAFMSVFRQDPTVTDSSRKFIFDAFAGAQAFRDTGSQALGIAQRLEEAAGRLPSGWQSSGEEFIKEVFGTQDDYSILRRDIQKSINANVLQALPPGPATDRDIAEAKKGFPPSNANAETLARYFRGVAKIQERKAAFEEFKGRYAAENVRLDGLFQAWEQEYQRLFPGEVGAAAPAPGTVDQRTPDQLPD